MKMFFRAIVFLAMLFAVIYVSINNTNSIRFNFPALQPKSDQPAALIYFAMFAVGVIAGLALGAGGQKPKAAASEGKKKA